MYTNLQAFKEFDAKACNNCQLRIIYIIFFLFFCQWHKRTNPDLELVGCCIQHPRSSFSGRASFGFASAHSNVSSEKATRIVLDFFL